MSFSKTLERITTLRTIINGIENKAKNASRVLTPEEWIEVSTYQEELNRRNRWLGFVD